MALLDIDRIPRGDGVSRLTSCNRWNWASFTIAIISAIRRVPLRERLARERAPRAGVALPDGPIYLLTHLRYAGYVFNPISIYYCYDSARARSTSVLADVRNTYGGRRSYWLRSGGRRCRPLRAITAAQDALRVAVHGRSTSTTSSC